MRKLFMMLIMLFLIYCVVQISFRFFGPGHNYDYTITTEEKKFNINEVYNNKTEKNYMLIIKYNENSFYYQTYHNFNKNDHIIKDVYQYNDDTYNCIFIKFKDDIVLSDIMCQTNGITYFYHNMPNKEAITPFISELVETGYNSNKWIDDANLEDNSLSIYNSNIINDHYISLNSYKGLYTINNYNGNKVFDIELFDKDVYQQDISIFYQNKYVIADYNQQYKFQRFFIIDVVNNKKNDVITNSEISFNSYIQGAVDNSVYLMDRDSKKQYEINIKLMEVSEVGNIDLGIKIYNNGEWSSIEAAKASNETVLFYNNYTTSINGDDYVRIDKIGDDKYGYTYFYKQNENKFDVYYKNNQQKDSLIYKFSTSTINAIKYIKDYVYYIDGDTLKYYNNETGVRRVLIDKELEFNKKKSFGIYIK